MNSKWKYTLIILVCIGICALLWWRSEVARKLLPSHIGIVLDRSGSMPSNCACLENQVKRALQDTPNITSRSTITMFVTGDSVTADEAPKPTEYPAPVNQRVVEGRTKADAAKKTLFDRLTANCREMKAANRSPIYLTVKRAVEDLQGKGKGCKSGSNCRLVAITDGEERAEKSIRLAIDGRKNNGPLPDKIENAGIEIVFIGFAETLGSATKRRDPKRTDRLKEVWKELFTHPDLVSFEPYCIEAQSIQSNPTPTH